MRSPLFKRLDILIVKAFIGPFIATFFVTVFVLVLQFFWLYIDDVVGKGVETFTVLRLIMYLAATLVPLALPLAMLLSSIMTLGNLGETFELIAIKSAGISLLRFMRPLLFVAILLTIVAFFFNNNVLPVANMRMEALKSDIIRKRPAFDIREGVFYDRVEGFVIKIGKKDKDGKTIHDVVIYEKGDNGAMEDNVIIADSGTMVVSPDKQSLIFTLKHGSRYQEKPEGAGGPYNTQLVRMSFDTYKKVMDLSAFKMTLTDASTYKNNYQMKTIFQLGHLIDSLKARDSSIIATARNRVRSDLRFSSFLDTTGWDKIEADTAGSKFLFSPAYVADSIHRTWTKARFQRDSVDKAHAAKSSHPSHPAAGHPTTSQGHPSSPAPHPTASAGTPLGHPVAAQPVVKPVTPIPGGQYMNKLATMPKAPPVTFEAMLPDSVRQPVMERANQAVSNAKFAADEPVATYLYEVNTLRQHEIAWHEKLTYAVAVLVMFLIGAPLGSIIRKGGIGMPLVFAVIFFVVFFLLNNFGRKFTKEGVMGPWGGMWLATYVLTPIGIFLTYKAMHDSQLFNKEFYFRISRSVRKFIQKIRPPRQPVGQNMEN